MNEVIKSKIIQERTCTIRGKQIMIDRDLAEMYDVQVKRLNEQVKRKLERFPSSFRFQLNNQEKNELVANCDRFASLKHSTVNPYAFTEQGVSMLSAVLHSKTAILVSIKIMEAFVDLRKYISENAGIFQRIEHIENKQSDTDRKFDQIFDALEKAKTTSKQHVFFDGQIFDAYTLIADIIRSAKNSVYHFGASLKDAGKKWFAVSKLEMDANDILEKL